MNFAACLVRPRAWWHNKLPLSVMTGLLLADGRGEPLALWLALAGLVGTVSAVANFGYAVNDLFDRAEDARAGRLNVATERGAGAVAASAAGSAAAAVALGGWAGGWPAAALTAVILLLPLTYSAPPLRTKERRWLGVLSDALAAHLYPALLAWLMMAPVRSRAGGATTLPLLMVWALATGLRGILSHQLHGERSDGRAGLATVVHRYGAPRILRVVLGGLLPVELLALGGLLVVLPGLGVTHVAAVLFIGVEAVRTLLNVPQFWRFAGDRRYIPFVDEGFYKVWGPLALIIGVALRQPWHWVLLPAFILLFRPRLRMEWASLRALAGAVRYRMARG